MLSPETTLLSSGSYEFRMRERVMVAGIALTLLFALVTTAYALFTWDQPNRTLLLVMAGVALVDVVASLLVPRRRVARSPNCDSYMIGWYLATVVYISIACAADGGVTSPIFGAYFVMVVFKGLVLPTSRVVGISVITILAAIIVAVAGGSPPIMSTVLLVGLTSCAVISAWMAHQHYQHRAAIAETQEETLNLLSRAVGFRDLDTGRHIHQISAYVALICRNLGCEPDYAELLRQASPMHDVGKIAIPDTVLLKPGRLNDRERTQVERHAELGYDLLAGTGNEILDTAATIALTHHEHYDGAGYPHGLSGENIPLEGRIVAVADVFDALTSDRVYRPALSVDSAIDIIVEGSGTHFDPQVANAFLADIEAIHHICDRESSTVEQVLPTSYPALAPVPAAA